MSRGSQPPVIPQLGTPLGSSRAYIHVHILTQRYSQTHLETNTSLGADEKVYQFRTLLPLDEDSGLISSNPMVAHYHL